MPWCFVATRLTCNPALRAASAVTGPTAAMRSAANDFMTSSSSDCERSTKARTALALVKRSQSKMRNSRSALSRGAKSYGGWKATMGERTALAPRASSSRTNDSVCSDALVMRMFRPARRDRVDSATLTTHFFEDRLRTGFDEQPGNVFAESHGLVRRGRSALPHQLRAINRTDAGFENELSTLGARPGAHRNLAAALQRGEQCALGDDGGTSFGIVESAENLRSFRIGEPAF